MHIPVMKEEVLNYLNPKEDGIYVDATLGYAGHSSSIIKRLKRGKLIAFDVDKEALSYSDKVLRDISSNYELIHDNFRKMDRYVDTLVDGILIDAGVSSLQLDNVERGFNYHLDSELDLRLNQEEEFSGKDVVNNYELNDLVRILKEHSDEKYALSIAKSIIKERPINTTFELVAAIKNGVPMKYSNKRHPARKTFQAIRIEVNDEFNALEEGIRKALKLLKVGGRLLVISFHSKEDKIVKTIFEEVSFIPPLIKGLPNVSAEMLPDYQVIKKIKPSNEEVLKNPRSRSAVMRVIERVK